MEKEEKPTLFHSVFTLTHSLTFTQSLAVLGIMLHCFKPMVETGCYYALAYGLAYGLALAYGMQSLRRSRKFFAGVAYIFL